LFLDDAFGVESEISLACAVHYTAYQTSPLGRTILGPEENIKNMTRDHIVNYIQANYVAPRMVVVAAGNVDHDAFTAQVAKAFAATPETPSGPSVITSQSPAWFTGSDIRVRDDDVRTLGPYLSPFSSLPLSSYLFGCQVCFVWLLAVEVFALSMNDFVFLCGCRLDLSHLKHDPGLAQRRLMPWL